MAGKRHLIIQLNGPFCLLDKNGHNITPKNRKAQALLALLATSPSLRRNRPWLQDKLWSQSDPERGSASLRQTLTAIRRALGQQAHVLEASRLDVALNADAVEIVWDKGPQAAVFLEGLDIADPEFEDWLRIMRHGGRPAQRVPTPQFDTQSRWKVALRREEGGPFAGVIHACADIVTRVLREQGELELTDYADDRTQDRLVIVDIGAVPGKSNAPALRLTAHDPRLNRQIWAKTWNAPPDFQPGQQDLDLLAMTFRLQTELTRYMALSRNQIDSIDCPPLVLGAAIPRIFSFQPGELDLASKMLSEAMDSRNAAQFLGWQAQIAVINLIEKFIDAPEACVEQGKELAAKAIEMDPMNSVVLSTAANAQVLLDRGDASAGADLAQLAVRVNPANPFAWWAYANVAIYSGNTEEALKSARIASRLAAQTPLQFWCDFQLGMAALKAGDMETAKHALETSASLSPQFRPPRRYLLAIYAHEKEFAKAARVLVQLKKLEPGFSLDGFVNDKSYPNSLARQGDMLSWSTFQDLTGVI